MHVHPSGQGWSLLWNFSLICILKVGGFKKQETVFVIIQSEKKILQSCRFFLHREIFGYQSAEKHPRMYLLSWRLLQGLSVVHGGRWSCLSAHWTYPPPSGTRHQPEPGIKYTNTHAGHTDRQLVSDTSTYKASYVIFPWNTMFLSQSPHSAPNKSQNMKRQQVKLGWPPEVYLTVFQATLFELGMTVLIYHLPSDSGSQKVETRQVKLSDG